MTNEQVAHPQQKRKPTVRYQNVEEWLLDAISNLHSIGVPLSGPNIQSLAKNRRSIYCPLDLKEVYKSATFTDCWLEKFKKRNGFRMLRINGERASIAQSYEGCMNEITEAIAKLHLPNSHIFNWDETGLFYRNTPYYSLCGPGDNSTGGKNDNVCITLMLSINADGSSRDIVLIGKSKTPRNTCADFWLQNGLSYYSNQSAWMDSTIFNKLLLDFDRSLNSPAVLLLDNFAGHKICNQQELQFVVPIFLPANTTAKTQPLDAGIISAVKIHFRQHLMDFIMARVLDGTFKNNLITLHLIAPWIRSLFDQLKNETVLKCFYKALKMDQFQEVTSTLSDPVYEVFLGLTSKVNKLCNTRVTTETLHNFIFDENQTESKNQVEICNNDEVVIQNPLKLMKWLKKMEEYWTETQRHHCLGAIHGMMAELQEDLDYFNE